MTDDKRSPLVVSAAVELPELTVSEKVERRTLLMELSTLRLQYPKRFGHDVGTDWKTIEAMTPAELRSMRDTWRAVIAGAGDDLFPTPMQHRDEG